MPATRVDLNAPGELAELSWGSTTERRREIVLVALQRQSGASVGELLAELRRIFEAGGWPPAPWGHGRDDPYHGGLTQHLHQLEDKKRVESVPGGEDNLFRWRVVGRLKFECPLCGGKREGGDLCCQPCREGRADSLLPPPEFADVIRDYQHRTSLEVIFGVTHNFERVIRIGMPRGVLEHVLLPKETWEEAIEAMELR